MLARLFNICLMFFLSGITAAYAEVAALDSQSAATTRSPVVGSENILSMVLSLVLILAIVFLLAWGAKRFGGASFKGNAALKVITGISMGARERVVLVQVGEQQLLLGVSPGRVQTLHVLEKPIDPDTKENPMAGLFAERLKSVLMKSS